MTIEDRKIRENFPVLEERKVTYLDNSATTQRPPCVIKAVDDYYRRSNANPMRGLYELSIESTDAYENARAKVADFIGAASDREIVFTRNTTEKRQLK